MSGSTPSIPSYLKLSTTDQKAKFLQINSTTERRILNAFLNPSTSGFTLNIALKKANLPRNRYANVFPWDHTRVKLDTIADSNEIIRNNFDYINASYVKFNDGIKYIAAQGPLENTTHHFWSMAYMESEKQNTNTIIVAMVTPLTESGIVKCFQYWPDKTNKKFDFSQEVKQDYLNIPNSNLSIEYINETYNSDGDYLLTELNLVSGAIVKKVYHYYYFKWADAKTPPSISPLLSLSKEIRSLAASSEGTPVPIVHCSAGVGRTGTFIAIDALLNEESGIFSNAFNLFDKLCDPIFELVSSLRNDRMMMVQTVYQYRFLYESAIKLYYDRLTPQ